MAVPQQAAIRLLGDASVRIVRESLDTGRFGVGDVSERWSREIAGLRVRAGAPRWASLPLITLAVHEEDQEDPTLAFGRAVAQFLLAMPSDRIEQTTIQLIDVAGEAAPSVRDDVTSGVLRIVEESAGLLGERVREGRMAPVVGLPSKLAALDRTGELREQVRAATIALVNQGALPSERPLHEVLGLRQWGLQQGIGSLDLTGAVADRVLQLSPDELSGILSAERPADRAYVNVGLDDIAEPGRSRSGRPLAPGEAVWVWVEIGPRSSDAVAGEVEPIDPELLAVGQELEVVLFADAELSLEPAPAVGRLVVAATESFPVVRRMLRTLGDSGSLLDHRLYARVQVPSTPGMWRIRCGVFLNGVLVHVQELTLPVGTGEAPSGRTTFRLLSQFQAPDRFESLRAPSLTIYANNGEASHDFSFYLPNGDEPALTKQVALDPTVVVTLTGAARDALRIASWDDASDGEGKDSKFPQQADGTFGLAAETGRELVRLAVAGANLWLAFADRMEADQAFRGELRERMAGMGTVQLGIKDSPDLIVPLQLLYDRKLDTSQPQFLHLCAASAAWLTAPAGDLPCLTQPCPSLIEKDPDLYVCIAGFWGIRHAITLNLAHRPCDLVSTVSSSAPPPATIATSTDPDVAVRWAGHEQALRSLLAFVPAVATTSTDVFASVDRDASVLVYFLAHVEYDNGVPRIVMDDLQPRGAINASTIDSAQLHLCMHQPVVFMNACASAAMTPLRLLGLVNAWVRAGAGGAVGTEIMVFVDMAITFAEQMLAAYTCGATLGEALRQARVNLLRLQNPLGFAYLGFGLHDLRIKATGATTVLAGSA